MKDLNNLKKPGGVGKESKAMKVLQNLKNNKVGSLGAIGLKKVDGEFKKLSELTKNFRDNKLSKEDFNKEVNVIEKFISGSINDAYLKKYGEQSNKELYVNRLSQDKKGYDLAIGNSGEDARFESFSSIDDILVRMKYLNA